MEIFFRVVQYGTCISYIVLMGLLLYLDKKNKN